MGADLNLIYERARNGDNSARDELIEACLEYVPRLAGAYVKKHGDEADIRDILDSSGRKALVVAVDRLLNSNRTHDGIEKILKRAIRNGIHDQAAGWTNGGEAKNTTRRQRTKCKAIQDRLDCINEELRACRNLEREAKLISERDTLDIQLVKELPLAGRLLTPADEQVAGENQFASLELREVIDSCCRNERELSLVELRSQGMTDAEVGVQLRLSHQRVTQIRHEIEARFTAKMKEIEGVETSPTISPLSRSAIGRQESESNLAIGA